MQAPTQQEKSEEEQIKAADYDPSLDRREDERRRYGPETGDPSHDAMVIDDEDEEEEVEVTDDEGVEEDVDDMFALVLAGDDEVKEKKEKKTKLVKRKKAKVCSPPTHSCFVDSNAFADWRSHCATSATCNSTCRLCFRC